jgi:hypothetical protein
MVERAPKPPSVGVPLVDKEGRLTNEWYKYLTGGVKFSQNVNSGVALIAQQQAAAEAALAAERAARIVNDAAVQAAAGGGAAMTSNAVAFSGGVSSGATWVTIATVTLTPTGAGGDYSITAYIDGTISGGLSDDGTVDTSFAGNWRIREELTSGGTEYTLDSGTFTVDYAAAVEESEAGIPFTIGPFWTTSFTGLPLTAVLIPANEGAQVDIRLEIQRASGTNEITAPGLSGSMSVVWTA